MSDAAVRALVGAALLAPTGGYIGHALGKWVLGDPNYRSMQINAVLGAKSGAVLGALLGAGAGLVYPSVASAVGRFHGQPVLAG